MKTTTISLFFALLLMLCLTSSTMIAKAPDTVRVYAYPSTWPAGSLDDVINRDTIVGGYVKPNTVFLLEPKGTVDTVYYILSSITVKGSVTVIGKVNPKTGHPPVLAPYINSDNSSIGDFFEPQGNDTLTLKGLYFLGTRQDGQTNTSRFITPSGDNNVFIFDHCILDNITGPANTPNLFDTWAHAHCSFYITNSEFRNSQDDAVGNPGLAWIEVSDPLGIPCDTAYFRNNTFFFNGGLVLGGGGYACNKLDFQHNTIFMSTQQGVFELYHLTNATITNNVFYSVGSASQPSSWGWTPGNWFTGSIVLDTLNAALLGPPFNLTEAGRHITITNNAYFWPSAIKSEWTKLSLSPQQLIGARGDMLTNKTKWPNINTANNQETDPGFDATIVAQATANMIKLIDTAYGGTASGSAGGYRPYIYKMAAPTDRSTWTNVASDWATTKGYPVPENLRYSSTTLKSAGTDGKALGDLNWFPEQITAVSEQPNTLPTKFELSQNYPNPFNPSTKISYILATKGLTRLSVYDVLGREVAVLVNEVQNAGSHDVSFTANNLSSGVYFYKLMSSETTSTMKMVLMK